MLCLLQKPNGCKVLASIQGGRYDFERQRSAAEAAKRQGVSGFSIAGLGTGESRQERRSLMQAAIAELPTGLPRFLLAGAGRQPFVTLPLLPCCRWFSLQHSVPPCC